MIRAYITSLPDRDTRYRFGGDFFLQSGNKQSFIRALVICMLSPDKLYQAAEVIATGWPVGSEDYRRHRSALNKLVGPRLKNEPDNADPNKPGKTLPGARKGQRQVPRWNREHWMEILSHEAYAMVQAFMKRLAEMDAAHRATGRHMEYYWLEFEGLIQRDLHNPDATFPMQTMDIALPQPPKRKKAGAPGRGELALPDVDEQGAAEETDQDQPGPSPRTQEEETPNQPLLPLRPASPCAWWVPVTLLLLILVGSWPFLIPNKVIRGPQDKSETDISPSARWQGFSVEENRRFLETITDPEQIRIIARAISAKTNVLHPYRLDDTRVLVDCSKGRMFVVLPKGIIELGDWVTIPIGDEVVRGALIFLSITRATVRTVQGVEVVVPLPYPEGWIPISLENRRMEALPMRGGNLLRIIVAYGQVRGGIEHGPLNELDQALVIGRFDGFKDLIERASGGTGVFLEEGRIYVKDLEVRRFIRYER